MPIIITRHLGVVVLRETGFSTAARVVRDFEKYVLEDQVQEIFLCGNIRSFPIGRM